MDVNLGPYALRMEGGVRSSASRRDGPPPMPASTGPAEPPRPRGASRVVPADDPSRDPRRPVRVARGVSALLVGLCVLGAIQASIMITVEVRRAWLADREVVRLTREVTALEREAADLAAIAERGDDLRFREHLARRQGYAFPDETRFVVIPGPPSVGPLSPPGVPGDAPGDAPGAP